ncbi:hypothetical protein H3146_22405, partial [Streptomyces sp. OF3]|nr:hypothetical protein [Streptomyces alkaliterrae]
PGGPSPLPRPSRRRVGLWWFVAFFASLVVCPTTVHGDALHVEVHGSSNVTVRFARPVRVLLPREGERVVSAVHLWADEPRELVRLLSPDGSRPVLD